MTTRFLSTLAAAALLAAPAGPAFGQVAPSSPDRGWIGISVEVRTDFQGSRPGTTVVTITDVDPASPAWASGVRPGDLLVSINGRPYDAGFVELARSLRPGDDVALVVSRDGRAQSLRLKAASRPVELIAPPQWTVELRVDTIADRMFRAMDSLRLRVVREGPGAAALVARGRSPTSPDTVFGRVVVEPGDVRVFRFPTPEPDSAPVLAPEQRRPLGLHLFRRSGDTTRAAVLAPGVEAGGVWSLVGEPGEGSVGFRPLSPYALGRNRAAGAEVVDLQPQLAEYFGVEGGVLVVDVAPGTPAALAGVLPGDVIVRVGDAPVTSIAELRLRLERSADSLSVRLVRKGSPVEVRLRR